MRNHEIKNYHDFEYYNELANAIRIMVGLLIFSICKQKTTLKRRIAVNFISRAVNSLNAIFSIWQLENYTDCYVLMRGIMDRLFHLHDLIENDKFQEFDDWSFLNQMNARNSVRSNQLIKEKVDINFFKDSEDHKVRYERLSKNKPQYSRPKPEAVAKSMGLDFMYKFGYDFASSLVHPLSNDGWEDFIILTGIGNKNEIPDHRNVLNNSILSTLVLINTSMDCMDLKWRNIVLDFFEHSRDALNEVSTNYKLSFVKISKLGPETILCQENA